MQSKIGSRVWMGAFMLAFVCGSVSGQDVSADDLLGSWESSLGYETLVLVFRSSTQLEFDGESASYTLSGNVLRVQEDYGSVDYPFALDGNTLTIAFPDGTQMAFSRTSAGDRSADPSSPEISAGSGNNVPPASGTTQNWDRGSDQQLMSHFVGVWVNYTKNTQTSSYLAADGTYYQNYEASYSGGMTDQYGNNTGNWGTAREDSEQARWTVQGSRESGTLILTYGDGSTVQVPYQVHVEKGYVYWNEYYFDGTLYGKKQE